MYQTTIDPVKNTVYQNMVLRTTDNTWIILNPLNKEAVKFGYWLKAGNLPTPAANTTLDMGWVANTITLLTTNTPVPL